MKDFKVFEQIFDNYVERFIKNANDDEEKIINYTNKKMHSYRVRDNIVKIAKDENLKVDMFIVEFIGLFHDIGRFYQYDKYKTFNDANSENHAKLSVKVLEDEQIINLIDYEDRKYIIDSILMHNLQDLPKIEDKNMYFYASLLRDADKLDGFRNMIKYDVNNKKIAYYKNKVNEPIISDDIYKQILENKTIYKYNLNTILEVQVTTLGYITSDINYDSTLRIIKDNDYVKKMFYKMQDIPKSRDIYEHVLDYVEKRLKKE